MYDELVKRLREHNGWALNETLDEAADAIEQLSNAGSAYGRGWTLGYDIGREENKPRWIPVTEQCPEKSGDYLVFDDCRNLYVNEWHCLLKKWQYDDSRITHWQPLPEPPKEET